MFTLFEMRRRSGSSPLLLALGLAGLMLAGCGDPMLRRGHDALGQGRYAEAIEAFEDVRGRLPEAHPAAARQSAHRALAAEQLAAGRCAEGRAQLVQAERFGPALLADHRALYVCGSSHPVEPAARLADLERLVALGEQRVDPRLELMRRLFEAGRDADAVALVPRLERRYALTLADHEALVGAWDRAGRPAAARPHVLKVLQARPDDLLARLKLAEIEERRGDVRAAGALYAALAAEQPTNPVIFMRLAAFHRRQNDEPAARAALARARALQDVADDPRGALRPLPRSRR